MSIDLGAPSIGFASHDTPTIADIRLSIISDHEWRICDRRIPESNGECVLGYIENTGRFYEVMRLASPRRPLYFTDFDEAVASFC